MRRYASQSPCTPGGTPVYVVEEGACIASLSELTPGAPDDADGVRELDPRTDLANHSPTGFSWGYRGSGPAQLALAICADMLDDKRALRVYQDVKEEVVAARPDHERLLAGSDEVWAVVRA
jgi:hypothetical protein